MSIFDDINQHARRPSTTAYAVLQRVVGVALEDADGRVALDTIGCRDCGQSLGILHPDEKWQLCWWRPPGWTQGPDVVWYLSSRHRDTMTYRGRPDPKGPPVRTGGFERRRRRIRTVPESDLPDDLIPLPLCIRCPKCGLLQWVDRSRLGELKGLRYWRRAVYELTGSSRERRR